MGLLNKRKLIVLVFFSFLASALILWGVAPSSFERRQQLLLSRLQEIQNLQVLEAHFLAHETVRDEGFLNTNEFLLVAKGKAVYGLDLAQVKIENQAGQMIVMLPAVTLQEMVLSPRDIEFLGVKKGWLTRQSQFEQYQRQALIKLEADLKRQARQGDYIQRAEKQAEFVLTQLLRASGLENVIVRKRQSHTEKTTP